METKTANDKISTVPSYEDLIKQLKNHITYNDQNFSQLCKENDAWYAQLRNKFPKDKCIRRLSNEDELLCEDIILYIKHFQTLKLSDDELKEAVNQLHIKQYILRDNAFPEYDDLLDITYKNQKDSGCLINHIIGLTSEIDKLKKENAVLSGINTELLLRPEGPVSIELGKKFIANSDKQQNM